MNSVSTMAISVSQPFCCGAASHIFCPLSGLKVFVLVFRETRRTKRLRCEDMVHVQKTLRGCSLNIQHKPVRCPLRGTRNTTSGNHAERQQKESGKLQYHFSLSGGKSQESFSIMISEMQERRQQVPPEQRALLFQPQAVDRSVPNLAVRWLEWLGPNQATPVGPGYLLPAP